MMTFIAALRSGKKSGHPWTSLEAEDINLPFE